MKKAMLFSKSTPCPYCEAAKNILRDNNIPYTEIIADSSSETKRKYRSMVPESVNTVPQIFIDNKYIGGYNELVQIISERTADET